MNFLYPKILYALPLLIIPVIIHLVHWKKFKKQSFTNLEFLKELEIKSRKSKKLKELLILTSRILAFLFLILAFAVPNFNKKNTTNKAIKENPVIYFDNSLSMGLQKGKSTEFFKSKMALIKLLEDHKTYRFFSNSENFKEIEGSRLKDYIYKKLKLSSKSAKHKLNLKKGITWIKEDSLSENPFIYITDNQNVFNEKIDSGLFPEKIQFYIPKNQLENIKNISLDSLVFLGKEDNNLNYKIWISSSSPNAKTPLIIKSGNQILWSSKINFKDSLQKSLKVSLPEMNEIQAEINVEDQGFPFDNHLYCTYSKPPKIPVLFIGEELPDFIKKIYTKDEFNLIHKKSNQIDYSTLSDYNLVILYRVPLKNISINNFKNYIENYGNLAIIPLLGEDFSPQEFKKNINKLDISIASSFQKDTAKVLLNRIHFNLPFFKKVFLKPVTNFDYPEINQHLKLRKNSEWLYLLSDRTPFVQKYTRKGNVFLFSTELSSPSFINHPFLLVPLFYQMGKWEQNHSKPYFLIGEKNTWTKEIQTHQKEAVIKLKSKEMEVIPFQVKTKNKIRITTEEQPGKAGIYAVTLQNDTIDYVAYNYKPKENSLKNLKWPELSNIKAFAQFELEKIEKSKEKNSPKSWKIFIFMALLMLIIEMLIIKFWK